MTHTLHRIGSLESLKEDFVIVFLSSKGINREGGGPKFRRFFEIALDHGAIKIGDAGLGNEYYQGGVKGVLENACDRSSVVHAVFKDVTSVTKMLQALKKEGLGLSVVVSGLFDEVKQCCRQTGLEMHTVNQSLGRWGQTDKLPPQEILEIHTMCGHGMVTVGLINNIIDDITRGRNTPEEGAERLFRPCMCGIFNPYRAIRLLRAITKQEKTG